MIEFIVEGNPTGKARARYSARGGYVRAYTPKNTRDYEQRIRDAIQDPKTYPKGTPVRVFVKAFYPIPKSMPKYKRAMIENGELRPTTKPDLDNVLKSVLDACNGICYEDDNQIVTLWATKEYSDFPRIEVLIKEVGEVDGR